MKKGLALFFATYMFIGSLFPGNSFFEFSGVPSLIKHFQHHRTSETPGIGFLDFMAMHYANYRHEKSDPVNHAKLPVHHGLTAAINDQALPSRALINTSAIINYGFTKVPGSDYLFIPFQFALTIFHPPKV